MPAKSKKLSAALIAKKCGVSKMTVSRVFRNKGNVSLATRRLVLDVAERSGFVSNGRYAGRNSQATKNYYVLFQEEHSLKDVYFSDIILSIQHQLFKDGFSCSFSVIKDSYSEFLKLINILRTEDIRGIFVIGDTPPSYINGLQSNFINVVLIDYPGSPEILRPYNAICIDNVFGGHLAMHHLLKLGRKRILLICGREGHYFSDGLTEAYTEALTRNGIEVCPELIVHADFHVNGGFRATTEVLRNGIEFDAIFSNDEMACGALKALAQAGIDVPGDVSIVGYDGLPIGEAVSPSLTTVAVDRTEMGRLAVKRLLAIEKESVAGEKHEKISIFPKLVVRESCTAKVAD